MRAFDGFGRAGFDMAEQPVPGVGQEDRRKVAILMGGDRPMAREHFEKQRRSRAGEAAHVDRLANFDSLQSIVEEPALDIGQTKAERPVALDQSAQAVNPTGDVETFVGLLAHGCRDTARAFNGSGKET